ncbi:hypothetical protein [Desulfuromonas sp. TF]|uniref:hypothetical protein n=1 Tax=Desulfuromonas sp. TF TaxID=1232410 RepID=UPI0004150AD3|nr:hypothetical protein [Desulfuromonas sp. TF]
MNRNSALIVFLFLLSPVFFYGCGPDTYGLAFPLKDRSGSIHYLIIGAGVVTVPKNHHETAVLATRSHALGVVVSDQPGVKMGVGYLSSQVLAVPEGAEDVRVEIFRAPGGPIIVDTQRATLESEKREGENEEKP